MVGARGEASPDVNLCAEAKGGVRESPRTDVSMIAQPRREFQYATGRQVCSFRISDIFLTMG